MRIGIDAHFASYELRGIGKYVIQLVSRLIVTQHADSATADLGADSAEDGNEYVIYGDPQRFPNPNGGTRVRFRDPGGLAYPLWEQCVLPLWARQDRLEVLHCPANTAPVALSKRIKLVITIHDVMYLLPSALLSASKVPRQKLGSLYRRMVVPRAAGRADRIITVSEFSRQEIIQYLKIIPDRIRVIHEGIDPRFGLLAGAAALPDKQFDHDINVGGESLNAPFILALGAGDPRKNTLAVIRAYGSVWRELPHQEKLVIVGLRDWRSSAAYRLVRELGLSERVTFAGYVSEELLTRLYTASRCFLYPTLYEGFGFPVLEAMACGTPVIASNCTAVSEIAGDAAILVDPSSDEAIGGALVRILRDDSLRRRLIQEGRARVRKFGWEETVEKTRAVYAEL